MHRTHIQQWKSPVFKFHSSTYFNYDPDFHWLNIHMCQFTYLARLSDHLFRFVFCQESTGPCRWMRAQMRSACRYQASSMTRGGQTSLALSGHCLRQNAHGLSIFEPFDRVNTSIVNCGLCHVILRCFLLCHMAMLDYRGAPKFR